MINLIISLFKTIVFDTSWHICSIVVNLSFLSLKFSELWRKISLNFLQKSCSGLVKISIGLMKLRFKGESKNWNGVEEGYWDRILERRIFEVSLSDLKTNQHKIKRLMLFLSFGKTKSKNLLRGFSEPRKTSSKEIHLWLWISLGDFLIHIWIIQFWT